MVAVLLPSSALSAQTGVTCDGLRATIIGTSGDDVLLGTENADVIAGLQGNDQIRGLGGDDIICGGKGGDRIWGGQGFDVIFGAQGNDIIYAADGASSAELVDVKGSRIFAGQGNDVVHGSTRWDRMQGGPGSDRLLGYQGRDWIRGGSGPDQLFGGSAPDDLHGGNGPDTISAGAGDVVRGGAGRDRCGVGNEVLESIHSCGRNRVEPGAPLAGTVVVADNATAVSASEVVAVAPDGAITVELDGASNPTAGDIVLIEPSDDLPSGHVGRVSAVTSAGVESDPIPIIEAIPEIDVSGTTRMAPTQGHGGFGTVDQSLNANNRSFDLLSTFAENCSPERGATLENSLRLVESSLEYDFSWGDGKPNHARLVAHLGAELETEFGLELLAGECNFEAEIGREWLIFRGVIPSTAIPIEVTLQGEVELTASAAVTVMQGTGTARVDIEIGFDYLDGDTSIIRGAWLSTDFDFEPGPGIAGELEVLVGGALDIEIGGEPAFVGIGATAEVEFFTGGGFVIEVEPGETPWWTADLVLKSNIEIELEISALLFGREIELFDAEISLGEIELARHRLAEAGEPYEGPLITTAWLPQAEVGSALPGIELRVSGVVLRP